MDLVFNERIYALKFAERADNLLVDLLISVSIDAVFIHRLFTQPSSLTFSFRLYTVSRSIMIHTYLFSLEKRRCGKKCRMEKRQEGKKAGRAIRMAY